MARRLTAENFDPTIKAVARDIISDINFALDSLKTRMCASAGLVIKAGGGVLIKTGGSACQALANGVLRSIAAATDMAAFAGTVTNAKFNVFCFFIDSAGTLTSSMGTEAATLAGVIFPAMPAGKACVGFTIINPTGTGNFVGNTTALDDATVVPNAVHVSLTGGFNPSYVQNVLQ